MNDNPLSELSMDFAVDITILSDALWTRKKSLTTINQLLRSGTSIGANIHEANYASSKADFINKLQISLKECNETVFWLNVFHRSDVITKDEFEKLIVKCNKIRRMLIASINTAKTNLKREYNENRQGK